MNKNYIIFIAATLLLICFVPFLRYAGKIKPPLPLPEKWNLPAQIGEWKGKEVYYSTDPAVTRMFTEDDIITPGICPVSGAELDKKAHTERTSLPADTEIRRRIYFSPDGLQRLVILLINGASREGIHRPEWCLAGQGFRVGQRHLIRVSPQNKEAFSAGVYPLIPENAPDGYNPRRYFVYWFEDRNRRTPYNGLRIILMGIDRLRTGRVQRWAYYSMQLHVPPGTADVDAYLADAVTWLIE